MSFKVVERELINFETDAKCNLSVLYSIAKKERKLLSVSKNHYEFHCCHFPFIIAWFQAFNAIADPSLGLLCDINLHMKDH